MKILFKMISAVVSVELAKPIICKKIRVNQIRYTNNTIKNNLIFVDLNKIGENSFMTGTILIPYMVCFHTCKYGESMIINYDHVPHIKYNDKQILLNLELTLKLENGEYDDTITQTNPTYIEIEFIN